MFFFHRVANIVKNNNDHVLLPQSGQHCKKTMPMFFFHRVANFIRLKALSLCLGVCLLQPGVQIVHAFIISHWIKSSHSDWPRTPPAQALQIKCIEAAKWKVFKIFLWPCQNTHTHTHTKTFCHSKRWITSCEYIPYWVLTNYYYTCSCVKTESSNLIKWTLWETQVSLLTILNTTVTMKRGQGQQKYCQQRSSIIMTIMSEMILLWRFWPWAASQHNSNI